MSRLAIYVIYDQDGILDGFRKYYLQEVRKYVDYTLVVVNGELTSESRNELENHCDDCFVRENRGYVTYAFKAAIDYLGWENICLYNELLMLNDSFFGPVFSLQDFFLAMEKSNADFYGETKVFERKDIKSLSGHDFKHGHYRGSVGDFYVIRNRLLHSIEFRKYFDQEPIIETVEDSLWFFERNFYDYVIDAGFIVDTYMSDKLKGFVDMPMRHAYAELLKHDNLPFVRHYPLTKVTLNEGLHRSHGKNPRQIIEFLEKNTDYDTGLIWDYVLRTSYISDIWERFQLEYVVSADSVEMPFTYDKRIAVIVHLYYPFLVEECANYCSNFPENTDFYVTTTSEDTCALITETLTKRGLSFMCTVRPNVGADVPTLWVTYADVVTCGKYEYICYFHDHHASYFAWSIDSEEYKLRTCGNLFGSKEIVKNAINLFEANPRLGILGSPPIYSSHFFDVIAKTWPKNYEKVVDFAGRLSLKTPISKDRAAVSAYGAMFWFRADAFTKALAKGFDYDDFEVGKYQSTMSRDGTIVHGIERIYGLIAQDSGYYYADLINSDYARSDLINYRHIVAETVNVLRKDRGYFTYAEDLYSYLRKRLEQPSEDEILKNRVSVQEFLEKVPASLLLKKLIKRITPGFIWRALKRKG